MSSTCRQIPFPFSGDRDPNARDLYDKDHYDLIMAVGRKASDSGGMYNFGKVYFATGGFLPAEAAREIHENRAVYVCRCALKRSIVEGIC